MRHLRRLGERLNRPVIIPTWLLIIMIVVMLINGVRYFHG